jgi:hypothetical protein
VTQNLATEVVVQNLSSTINTLGLANILDSVAKPRQHQPPPAAVVEEQPTAVPPLGDETRTEAARLKAAKNAKKLEKTLCFRCVQTCHMAIDCTT